MSEINGNGKSRLDQIEEIMERHSVMMIEQDAAMARHSTMMIDHEAAMARLDEMIGRGEKRNEAAHERFEEESKRLLTAQILMNGAMQKMAQGMISLESKMEESTGKLNILLETVGGIIRRQAS